MLRSSSASGLTILALLSWAAWSGCTCSATSGTSPDGSAGEDASPGHDSGLEPDAATEPDASVAPDAGNRVDSGTDAGLRSDSGTPEDAGSPLDSGSSDSGTSEDAGTNDAGTCTTACDCPTGEACFAGRCAPGGIQIYCCTSPICPPNEICQDPTGQYGRCGANADAGTTTCQTACDCPPGEGCVGGLCRAGGFPIYCCGSANCPPGSLCQDSMGMYGRCAGIDGGVLVPDGGGLCGLIRCTSTANCDVVPGCTTCGNNGFCTP
jgi:hypothetical protein